MPVLERMQFIPAPPGQVFDFFSEARNLAAITPKWLGFRMVTPHPIEMRRGARIEYRISLHGVPLRWRTLISEWNPPEGFKDVQVSGPYKLWEHEHRFEPAPGGTLMRDTVRYELPLGALGRLVERYWVRRDLQRIFDYRAERIASLWRKTD
ncbi:MAG TPA: SRPBCC family protein [Bryobacteraceae bacterium]|nr:SRPBCC family protein [Bryobacteraceae bacterium]